VNLPNLVTFARLLLCVPFLILLEVQGWETVAMWIFVVASLTDWLDGYLARRLNQVSELGKLMDPLVDKVLVTGALVALTARGIVPAWSVTAILFREFLVTGLRAVEASRGVIIPAGWLGKVKATVQMIAIIVLLWCLDPTGRALRPEVLSTIGLWGYWAGVALTIASGVQYLWLGRGLFQAPPEEPATSP
jgi:CDP-diacylglycerol--glycerol-3-phosphate 3-phosphatidyltransferase